MREYLNGLREKISLYIRQPEITWSGLAKGKVRNPKLQMKWDGPFINIEQSSNLVYIIQSEHHAKSQMVH